MATSSDSTETWQAVTIVVVTVLTSIALGLLTELPWYVRYLVAGVTGLAVSLVATRLLAGRQRRRHTGSA